MKLSSDDTYNDAYTNERQLFIDHKSRVTNYSSFIFQSERVSTITSFTNNEICIFIEKLVSKGRIRKIERNSNKRETVSITERPTQIMSPDNTRSIHIQWA